jgi:hypothetical protein
MSKTRIIFILGIWVAIVSFLGFPSSWKKAIFVLTGVALIYLAYSLEKRYKVSKTADQTPLYTQSRMPSDEKIQ